MLFGHKNYSLDAQFDDGAFESIFLNNQYPGEKPAKVNKTKAPVLADKAEIWALYDRMPGYNGINLLRQLRTLWGIHTTLKIGPRSSGNPAVRGKVTRTDGNRAQADIWFEAYQGNISDATRTAIAFAPYDDAEKSRALSQKAFVRLVVPLKKKSALEKIDALLLAYSVAAFIDSTHFAGLVDPDLFLFVPKKSVRAGLASYHSSNRLLNTHLVTGFNFFESEQAPQFFTHGCSRFGVSEMLLRRAQGNKPLQTEDYAEVLKLMHASFLALITGKKPAPKLKLKALKPKVLPDQVAAFTGITIRELIL